MTDSRPWRERNLERLAEARRILETARTQQRKEPMTEPVNPDLEPVNPELEPDELEPDDEPELEPDVS